MVPFVVNGVVIGFIYGIVALGFVLVYKGTRTLNFAHGDMGTVAAFIVFGLWAQQGWPYLIVVPLALIASGGIGYLSDHLVMRHIHNQPRLTVLVATLAIAGIIQFVVVRVWDTDPKFMDPPLTGAGLRIGEIALTAPRLLALGVSAAVVVALYSFFKTTSAGLTFRAVALDPYAAQLMGVNVGRVSAATWTAGAMISGLAAILIAPLVSFHVFFMAVLFLRALTAALIGGLTNFGGTFVAAVLLGIGESFLARVTTAPGALEAVLFVVMVAALLIRPRGLFQAEY